MTYYSTKIVLSLETGELLSKDYVLYVGPWELCDRSAQAAASGAAKTAKTTGANLGADASVDRSSVLPGLQREAAGEGGYSPQDLTDMTTKTGEAVGGANSGVVGEANLESARTRNAGGFGAALDEASRNKSRANATAALDVSGKNADLKAKQKQFAQGELSNLYGTDTNSMLKAMGLIPQDVDAEAKAGSVGWEQNFTDILKTLSGSAAVGKGIAP